MSQLVYDMRDNTPNLIICTRCYLDWWILRILRFQIDFPLVEQQPLDGELLTHTHHDDSIVRGGDRPVDHDDVSMIDADTGHRVATEAHKEGADGMRYAQIIQVQALLFIIP